MLGDKVMQSSLITGSATDYTLTAVTSWQTWRQVFADTSAVLYVAENSDGSTWEIGYGTLAYGPPDKITGRTLLYSSTGALINWQTTDAPIYVFSATLNTVLKHLLSPLVNGVANVMGWLPAGAMWLDYALGIATAWVKKRYISGTRTSAASHAEEGRHYLGLAGGAANIYAASLRSKFEDKGAANYVLTADDIGKTLAFDCTAASRTLTGIAAATTGVGHGFYFFVQPYGSSSNGVTFAPAGGDTTDLATAPATRRTMYIYDGAKGTWRADYVVPNTLRRSYRAGITASNNSGSPNTKIDFTAGEAADSTDAVMMSLAAVTLDCGTVGANGLDAGALAASTWYHAFVIGKADGTTAMLASTSPSAPTMPTGYIYKRRRMSFRTDASSHILAFSQNGDEFLWTTPQVDFNGVSVGTAASTLTFGYVPTGVKVNALFGANCKYAGGGADEAAIFTALDANDVAPSTTGLANAGTTAQGVQVTAQNVRTNTSAQIRARATVSSLTLYGTTMGWIDRAGRDD